MTPASTRKSHFKQSDLSSVPQSGVGVSQFIQSEAELTLLSGISIESALHSHEGHFVIVSGQGLCLHLFRPNVICQSAFDVTMGLNMVPTVVLVKALGDT